MQNKGVEILVGLFVLAGFLALGVLAFRIGNLGSATVSHGYTVSAEFDSIGGLKVRAPVSMAGVLIGRVTEINLDQNSFRARVKLKIGDQFDKLPKDTSAAIFTAGLLGEQYVNLVPGGDDTFLKNGDKLFITQSALSIENLIGQFMFNKKEEK